MNFNFCSIRLDQTNFVEGILNGFLTGFVNGKILFTMHQSCMTVIILYVKLSIFINQ